MARTALAIVLIAMLLVVCIRLLDLNESPAAESVGTEAPSQLAHRRCEADAASSLSQECCATCQSEILYQLGGLSFQSPMNGGNTNYLAFVSLGTPPSWHQLMVDTGSDLTWLQCKPCTNCFKQTSPLFNPATSSTYRVISDDSPACIRSIHHSDCPPGVKPDHSCCYGIGYADNSESQGILSSDTLGLNGTNVRIPGMIFGCSHMTSGYFESNNQGILGLGPGPFSLVSQLGTTIGRKFSYCLTSNSSQPSVLSFGDKAIIRGGSDVVSTPLIIGDHHYYVTLEGIIISDGKGRDHHLKIAVKTSAGSPQGINFMVDTGSFLTFLDVEIVEQLESKLSAIIKLPRATKRVPLDSFCYKPSKSEFLAFPEITFRLAGPAPMRLKPHNTFYSLYEDVMCLAIVRHPSLSILGSLAQGKFYIGYDLEAKQMYFTPADCNKMGMLAEERWLLNKF